MTKEKYIERLNFYKAYCEYEDKLDKLGIRLWEVNEVDHICANYIDMLAELAGDEEDEFGYSWTTYFCYECEFGKTADEHPITVGEDVYYLRTPEDVWNMINLD